MVDIAGGLLAAFGSAGAGGFKAMGENADQNIKDKAEKLKEEALFERQKSILALQQQYQTTADKTKMDFETGQNKLKREQDIELHRQTEEGATTRHKQTQEGETARHSETIAAQKANTAATIAASNESKRQTFELQKQMLDAKQAEVENSKAYQRSMSLLNEAKKTEELKIDREKMVQKQTQAQAEALPVVSDLLKSGDVETAAGIAALHGIPLKLEKGKVVKEHWYGDEKKDVTSIDAAGLLKPRQTDVVGQAKPTETQSAQPQPTQTKPSEIADLYNQYKQQKQSSVTSKPQSGGMLETKIPAIDRDQLSQILNRSDEMQTGAYKDTYAPGQSSSLLTGVQKLASKTQGEDVKKFGEGDLEFALRQSGYADDLAVLKDYSRNLRKEFPKLTDEQLVNLVMNATEPVQK